MFFCTNCGTIDGYFWIEYDFKFNDYNENIYNLLKCKNAIYHLKFFDKSFNEPLTKLSISNNFKEYFIF